MKLKRHASLSLKSLLITIAICTFTFASTNVFADDDWSTGVDAADLSSPGTGATGIIPSGSDTGTLDASSSDYYDMYITYPLDAETYYGLRFQLGTEGLPALIHVWDGNGNFVGSDFAEGSALGEVEIIDPVGSYYVRIYSPSGVNNYTLAIYLD